MAEVDKNVCEGCGCLVKGQPGWPVKIRVVTGVHPHNREKLEGTLRLCRVCVTRVPGLRADDAQWKEEIQRLLKDGRNWAMDEK